MTGWESVAAASGLPFQNYGRTCWTRADHTLWCWPSDADRSPVQVGTDDDWVSVSTGVGQPESTRAGGQDCGTRSDHTLWCWGHNDSGQLGDGTTDGTRPGEQRQIGGDALWATVSVGPTFTCATRTDHTLWCWGDNTSGQLGDGTTNQHSTPTQVGSDTDWDTPTTSGLLDAYGHPVDGQACATRTDHTLWCWGDNTSGGLGVVPPGSIMYQVSGQPG